MIYIENGAKPPLPKKYHYVHNITVICHDLMVGICKERAFKALFATGVKVTEDEQREISKIDGENRMLSWLAATNRRTELSTILVKHMLTSILADSCSFIYESLNCAMKGKMTIAYALIRKPLTDNLFLLEQLLVDPDDLIERFYHNGDSRSYDPSFEERKKDEFLNVITKCAAALKTLPGLNADLIFRLRYDSYLDQGLRPITTRAHHIVTKKPYSTGRQNLNFVFSIEKDYKSYWDHYYYFVPYLLFYASAVADALAFKLIKSNEKYAKNRELTRTVALIFWSMRTQGKTRQTKAVFSALSDFIAKKCPKCRNKAQLVKMDFELFLESGIFLCPRCFYAFA